MEKEGDERKKENILGNISIAQIESHLAIVGERKIHNSRRKSRRKKSIRKVEEREKPLSINKDTFIEGNY